MRGELEELKQNKIRVAAIGVCLIVLIGVWLTDDTSGGEEVDLSNTTVDKPPATKELPAKPSPAPINADGVIPVLGAVADPLIIADPFAGVDKPKPPQPVAPVNFQLPTIPQPSQEKITLTGTALGEVKTAMFLRGNKTIFLTIGDELNGRRIVDITADFARVFVQKDVNRLKFKRMLPLIASAAFFVSATASAAPMSLSVHDADLRSTIVLVGKSGGLNVLVDDSVKGNVSISVTNVDPVRVLEIIANIKNLRLLHEAGVYILTAELQPAEPMQSYVLPIKFGDAEILRKAVFKSLDVEPDKPLSETMKVKDLEGVERTYTYKFRDKASSDWQTDENDEKDPRSKRVFVNPEVNALVLYGTPTEYERVKNLLATLDVELKQVSVEARIIAIDKNATKNLGIEWMWSPIPQNSSTRKENMDSANAYGLIQFGRAFGAVRNEWYFNARINALVTDGKAQILSRPNVMTVQGREAVINVGSSVPVPKSQTTNSTVTTSIEYRDAGIILRYTPRINSDGTITAKIHTEVSTPQYVADMQAYRFNTRSADTTVTVRDGEPMIIGGLIGAEEEKSVSKIPFLGDLPILGALFRNHRKSKTESELIIFLTAHVLGGNADETLSDKP